MINWPSPDELAAHLSELVDDEEFILRTVRVHFPAFKREMKKAERANDLVPPPAKLRDPMSVTDNSHRARMERGSKELLHAIHKYHPEIMAAYATRGLQVIYP